VGGRAPLPTVETEGGQKLPFPAHQATRVEYSVHGLESRVNSTRETGIYKINIWMID